MRPSDRRGTVAVVATFVVATILAACTGGGTEEAVLPPPPPTTTTTERIDLTQVSLPAVSVEGSTTTTRPPVGRASIAGRVVEDRGAPVPGALVRAIWYHDSDHPEVIETISDGEGRYRFDQLIGGPWRVRAWLAPVMATLETATFWLGATEDRAADLKVKTVPEVSLTARMAPDPPLVGWPAELAVLVSLQTVNAEGAIERRPAANTPVVLTNAASWRIQTGSNPAITESDGTYRWILACGREGRQTLTAVAFDWEFPLTLPSCLSPASTTTTTLVPEGGEGTPTTTRPPPTTTTTPARSASATRDGA